MHQVRKMKSGEQDRIQEIFAEAMQLSPDRRAAFLSRVCTDQPELRSSVEGLLHALDHAGRDGFLTSPTSGSDDRPAPSWPNPSGKIGPYRLLERLGEGGFGEVWTAEQTEPMHRTVAVKILKLGVDSKEVLARFEMERQALALMDHPNVARIYDAGATDQGRPYFVMEHAAGLPITDYCDTGRLRVRQRLELFVRVCEAVQHAHTKGIIHRDLKPSNVLLTLTDGKPVPKVIDFGIAKATAVPLTDRTLHTEIGRLMGTPEYMSPEQAGSGGTDVDTRSDVYSLGVILYQLLTGTLPFEPDALRKADYPRLVKIIREMEPATPSCRLSTLGAEPVNQRNGATPQEIAGRRDTEFAALQRQVKGELDWIVMKCLEKDRARRYETAHELATDVQHFLSGEPVDAAPPSRIYRFRKFVRRNRTMVTAAMMVVVALLAGTAGTTFGLLRAEKRRAEADSAREQMQQVSEFQAAMLRGIDANEMGLRIKERFREQVGAALQRQYVGEGSNRRKLTPDEIEEELAEYDRRADAAQAVDVARQVMDEFVLTPAADTLEEQFADQPLVRAQLHEAIGRTYRELGIYAAADQHLSAALELRRAHYGPGTTHPAVLESLLQLAFVKENLGRSGEVEEISLEVLDMSRVLGNRSAEARALEYLGGAAMDRRAGAEAETRLNEALQINRELYGEDDPRFMGNLASLAVLYSKQNRHKEAESADLRVLEWRREYYGDQHPKVAHVLFNLAWEVGSQGRPDEAEELFREAMAIHLAVYGQEHPLVATDLFNIGTQIVHQGRRHEGEQYCRQALDQQRILLGEDSRAVQQTLRWLAGSREADSDFEEAITLRREILAIVERAYPEGHKEAFRRITAMADLGAALNKRAKQLLSTDRQRALALCEEAEPYRSAGAIGMLHEPRCLPPERRPWLMERLVEVYEFWHDVAPDAGWDVKAAQWRATLEQLQEP